MIHAKHYDTVSKFVKVTFRILWPLFSRTRCIFCLTAEALRPAMMCCACILLCFFFFFFCFILFPFDNLFGLLYISCLLLRINSIGLIIGRCAAARLEEAIAVELNTNVKIDGSNPLEHVVVIPRRHHRRPLTILLLTQ